MHTPLFPQWRQRLGALGCRVADIRQQSLLELELLFGRWLAPHLLSQAEEGPNSRERVYTLRRTFWGFLFQALNPACPCRQVVHQIQALFALHNGGKVDGGTGGFCQARLRLPLEMLQRIRHAVAARVQQHLPEAQQLWQGLSLKVLDGTSTTLPDTAKNQRAYPQSRSQKPGCGFPLMKLVAIFSLATGVLLDYAKGNKHQHELALLDKLLDRFGPRDLVLADRGFSSYVLLALLHLRGVSCLFRLHQARPVDFRKGKPLGKDDRLVTWRKPKQKPRYLPQKWWKRVPGELSVRLVRFRLQVPGFRSQEVILVTTLSDPKYSAQEIAQLYARRWRIELWFRDIKTTMGMESLRCKTPAMAHKELEMYLIAYNLIRALIVRAGAIHEVPLERISFKGTADAARQYSIAIARARTKKKQKELVADLLRVIALDEVPERPGRREPRAVKRRPKPYPLLNKPRRQFKEIAHRNRYWKNNPRNAKS